MTRMKRENADNADQVRQDLCEHVPAFMDVRCLKCGKILGGWGKCEACGELRELHPETGCCRECMDI